MTACVVALAFAPAALAQSPPKVVGSVTDSTGPLAGASAVAVSGNYAYTTAYYSGELTAVDISNPSNPVIAGHSSPFPGGTACPGSAPCATLNGSDVTISGGYAYVTSTNANGPCTPGPPPGNCASGTNDNGTGNSLTIYDIHTNPAVPAFVGTIQDPTNLFGAFGVGVQNGYAYVVSQGCVAGGGPCPNSAVGNDLATISLANPAAPTLVGTPLTGPAFDHADSLAISGNYLYVTSSYSNTLAILNISTPGAPSEVAKLSGSALFMANDVAVQGNYAYVANETTGSSVQFAIVDVSNPGSPKVVGTLSNPALAGAYHLVVSGNYAFVAGSSSDAISVINVSNPASPQVVGSVTDKTHLHRTLGLDFGISGRYLVAVSPYLTGQTRPLYPPYPLQTGGPTVTGTVSVVDLDPSPVSVLLTSPLNHSNYKQGQTITASYSCTPGGVFPLTSCTGTLPNGAPIDTSTLGTHTFTVTGTDVLGQTGSVTVTYTVSTTGGPTPSLSGLHESASVWREHGRKHVRHKPPLGTTLTFKLSQTAKVTLSFNRCTGHGRHVCKRTKLAGTIVLIGKQGKNKYFFLGKIGNKFLKPGTYKLVVVASANGKTSSRETISFTIV